MYDPDIGASQGDMTRQPFRASLVAQAVKNLPEMQENLVQPLDQEDSLVKGMVTHSSVPAWRNP